MLENGNYAIYHGKKYTSGKLKNGKYVLRSCDINDLEDGFIECEPFMYKKEDKEIICCKYVNRRELDEYYKITTYARYCGYKFEVVDESQEQISIVTMNGDWHEWERIGMTCIDKGVFQKWINKSDAEIYIEKIRQ